MNKKQNGAARAGFFYIVGNLASRGIGFVTLPVFTRLLSVAQYGVYSNYLACELVLSALMGLCLHTSLRSAKFDYGRRFGHYVASSLLCSLLPLPVLLVVGNLLAGPASLFLGLNREMVNLLVLHSYATFAILFFTMKYTLFYQFKKVLLLSFGNMVGGTLASFLLMGTLFRHNLIAGRIWGYALVPVLIAAVLAINCFWRGRSRGQSPINFKMWKYGLRIGLPLVGHTLAQTLLLQLGRIITAVVAGNRQAGVFGFMFTLASILHILVTSADNAWSVWFFEQMNAKATGNIREASKKYLALMAVAFTAFVCVLPELVRVMAPSAYQGDAHLAIIMGFAIYFAFLYSLPGNVEYYYKQSKAVLCGTALAAIVYAGLGIAFAHRFGYRAVAWAFLLAYMCMFLLHLAFASRCTNIRQLFPMKWILVNILYCGGVAAGVWWCFSWAAARYAMLATVLLVAACMHKKDLTRLFKRGDSIAAAPVPTTKL